MADVDLLLRLVETKAQYLLAMGNKLSAYEKQEIVGEMRKYLNQIENDLRDDR